MTQGGTFGRIIMSRKGPWALLYMAVSHFPVKGGDAIVGHRLVEILWILVCVACTAYILTIKAC